MYVSTAHLKKRGITVVRIMESVREEGKVKKLALKNVGQSKDPAVIKKLQKRAQDLIEQYKEGGASFGDKRPQKKSINFYDLVGKRTYNTGFKDILGAVYADLGFSKLMITGRNNSLLNSILESHTLMRIFQASSKFKSCELIEEHFKESISMKQSMNMMDHLYRNLDEIKERAFGALLKKTSSCDLLLFDVTTLYFDSQLKRELQRRGYSKDGKHSKTQLVLAVLANQEGMPLAYELFPGNTAETKTFCSVLNLFVKRFNVDKIRVAADRAMFSRNNFNFFEDLKKKGIQGEYLVSCPIKKLKSEQKEKIFDFKKDVSRNFSESKEYFEMDYGHQKIMVSFCKKREKRDKHIRKEIVRELESKADKYGRIRKSKLQKSTGRGKYIKKKDGYEEIDRKKIKEDELWDGLYGVSTNIENKKAEDILAMYRNLWKIEEFFRINKHTLKMRPIYHRKNERIESHVFICFLAYTVLRYTESILKKKELSFAPEKLIKTLKSVESFFLYDRVRGRDRLYCVPKELSKEAQSIYKVFGKKYSLNPYIKE